MKALENSFQIIFSFFWFLNLWVDPICFLLSFQGWISWRNFKSCVLYPYSVIQGLNYILLILFKSLFIICISCM